MHELNSNKDALKADSYLDLECEPSLVPPSRPNCSPPKADWCLQDTVAPELIDCGLPTSSLTLTSPLGRGYLDHRVDLGDLEDGWG